MKYRKLGKTDIEVSLICLGTMTWGGQNTETEGHQQLDYATDRGINFIDTAEIYAVPPSAETYGQTERIIGTWLHKTKNRNKVVLASKIAGPGPIWIREGQNKINKENIITAVEGSLKRLQTDYLDLYQIHWPNREYYHFQNQWNYQPNFDAEKEKANIIEVLQTLDQLIQSGKIRHIGLSNETAWGIMQYLNTAELCDLPRMVSIQNEYSLLCRLFEPDLQEIAMSEACGLLAWSPLARGMLSGKYLNGARPTGSRLTIDPRPDRRSTPQSEEAIKAYINLANQYEVDPCQMALAFVNTRPFVTSTIIGATNIQQLKNNIDSIDLDLGKEVLAGIDRIHRELPIPY